jgi:hypothetical protein
MLSGAHILIYSSNATADSEFLRDVLALSHVDAGEGFLIFGLPPAEVAMHETEGTGGKTELHLVCDDIAKFVAAMAKRNIPTDPPADRGWGILSSVTLPSGIKLGVYEPRHERPGASGAVKAAKKAAKRAKKAAKELAQTAKAVKKAAKKASKVGSKGKKK